jgi:hypothetical protein
MFEAETACTALSWLPVLPGTGLGTTLQPEPFQRSMRLWLVPSDVAPTAHALHGDSTATPLSWFRCVDGLGGCMPDQLTHVLADAGADASAGTPTAATTSEAVSGLRKRPIRRRLMSRMLGPPILVPQLRKPWVFNPSRALQRVSTRLTAGAVLAMPIRFGL